MKKLKDAAQSVKKIAIKCWQNTAIRNLANLLASVIISTQLISHGVDAQSAANIGSAAGAVIVGQ